MFHYEMVGGSLPLVRTPLLTTPSPRGEPLKPPIVVTLEPKAIGSIPNCHADVTPIVMLTKVSIRFSLLEPLSISMFASRGISHANKIISFHCSLSETPSLRKETREVLWNGNAYCKKMQEAGTAKAL